MVRLGHDVQKDEINTYKGPVCLFDCRQEKESREGYVNLVFFIADIYIIYSSSFSREEQTLLFPNSTCDCGEYFCYFHVMFRVEVIAIHPRPMSVQAKRHIRLRCN